MPAQPATDAPGASPTTPQQAAAPPSSVPSATSPSPAASAAAGPSFDVVLVKPDGRAVIAGRAVPGSSISILDGERVLLTARADARGEWTVVIDNPPLAQGAHDLRVEQRVNGREVARSDRTVTVVVPESVASAPTASPAPAMPPPTGPETTAQPPSSTKPVAPGAQAGSDRPAPSAPGALVVSTPGSGGPSTVLQAPGGPDALARSGTLVLGAVDYDEQGRLAISGQGPSGTTVRVYVDNKPVGEATAGADGRWTVQPGDAVATGRRVVRIDQVGPTGTVAARLEVPFERLTLARPGVVTVVRGDNLWNIARSRYGDGLRYTAIYEANKSHIRDPNLIYPGQTFVIPKHH
jgi:nucleoid-associated protein YgaU